LWPVPVLAKPGLAGAVYQAHNAAYLGGSTAGLNPANRPKWSVSAAR
jgi:hypothetical protein